jgi:hypothetical protein
MEIASGSAVYAGIWQNFLRSREISQNVDYASKKIIIITDGADDLYGIANYPNYLSTTKLLKKDIFTQKGNIGQTMKDFYNSICFINYGENSDDLMFADCKNSIDEIYDGTDENSYFQAFKSILPEMFFDFLLLYIIIGIVALLSLSILIIKQSIL